MPPRYDPARTDLMTVEQVAAYLQLNKLTVYKYIRDGRIPAARLGKGYRIRKADVDAFLDSRKVRQPVRAGSRRSGKGLALPARPAAHAPEIAVAPSRRETGEDHRELVNPMEWVIRGLH